VRVFVVVLYILYLPGCI